MEQPKIINLPKIFDPRGNLTFVEGQNHIPFDIKRAYWIYDVPGGETRGGHAFREQEEFIVALSGSFDVEVDNGFEKKRFHLNRSYFGLHIPAGSWRIMDNFSTNSLALVLASTFFDENDYIRNYADFADYIKQKPEIKATQEITKEPSYVNPNGKINTVYDCHVTELDINHREKGNITVIENSKIIPFGIKRIYYLYDIPGGEQRGGHAHKGLSQLIIAAGGSFDVELDDGSNKQTITLNRPYQGLHIVPGIWRELNNFSSGSTCLVLASNIFDTHDYIRDYCEFIEFKR